MVARKKIDSNETSLAYSEENGIGVAAVSPIWHGLEPNTYANMGGKLTLLARRPINSSRQRKKGEITDLTAAAAFNQDFTLKNTQDILQGYMFADFRQKATVAPTGCGAAGYAVVSEAGFTTGSLIFVTGFALAANNGFKRVTAVASGLITAAGLATEAPSAGSKIVLVGNVGAAGDIDVDVSGTWPAYTSTVLDFTTLGIIPGEWVHVGGDGFGTSFAAANNNGFKRVRSVTANRLEIDQSPIAMTTVASTAETIHIYLGRVLKNELGTLIKRRTYQLERQLGAPDTSDLSAVQSELVTGAVPAIFTLNVKMADKLNADLTFVATDHVSRTATDGLAPGTRMGVQEAEAFNTSSDIPTMRMSIIVPGNATPTPLFAHVTDITLKIDNKLTENKAVAVLGAFDVTAGMFEVSATATAYFDTVEAIQAVTDNDNVQLYAAFCKANSGVVLDVPLIALSDAQLAVVIDAPITLPLIIDAATAALLNPATDYTLMWCFYDYLPTIAG
jgi:hypothetical protein